MAIREFIVNIKILIKVLQRVGDFDEELRYRRELVDFYRTEDSKSDDTLDAMKKLAAAIQYASDIIFFRTGVHKN